MSKFEKEKFIRELNNELQNTWKRRKLELLFVFDDVKLNEMEISDIRYEAESGTGICMEIFFKYKYKNDKLIRIKFEFLKDFPEAKFIYPNSWNAYELTEILRYLKFEEAIYRLLSERSLPLLSEMEAEDEFRY